MQDQAETQRRMWGEKPYRSLDFRLREQFGEKVYKLSLNGGMTCPNRDGTVGTGGCIFCSAGGSGEFAADRSLSITEQIRWQKEALRKKKPARKYIAYFQAYTNTYAPAAYLEKIFTEAIGDDEVAVLSVATRPDCLPEEVLELLGRLNHKKPVWVELGLQTIHPQTARFIRRGYELSCFEEAVRGLRSRNIEVIVHTILGLPGEGRKEILETIDYLNRADIQGIKLQLLHILRGTDLGELYLRQMHGARGCDEIPDANDAAEQPAIQVLSMDAYIDLILDCVVHLSPDITIHRLTGDGPKELLLAPLWSSKKRTVLNTIHSRMREEAIWQGKYFSEQ
ncbi:MAG: TIGR01212 family radical SAM protein [Marvinbryantia sp.]|uniref:TIGR01212 family radical SAM protein n=1 Tax=Marvinbryantia sp. TaxID=2496532 RepID=UPI0025CBC0D0|nr:TIGR01212 family radical SAM protein [uncultured Marvinbryantia sp.]